MLNNIHLLFPIQGAHFANIGVTPGKASGPHVNAYVKHLFWDLVQEREQCTNEESSLKQMLTGQAKSYIPPDSASDAPGRDLRRHRRNI